ncbi:ArsB/NhaD family transporter [Thermosulfuriphilus ammonigenes]|uniref:ArsB/NhaD family transporter n=1 Tax=Thermosulfuriphilus ammonigenes TaxID=1936021 RepID=A0A6G7PU34_9BACT|nr:ArsB/NhaD family transporter [Thermosulfuriphilus ammonigenes]MBA2848942.1 Na+/H+ antiporter NhaD/arsenite permease-like protein [Thermosulfuriphilus ammonigenes]QIJ70943.1 ArsB/NhaD family transporter [Thermosulfuriphilus ammonigenes]
MRKVLWCFAALMVLLVIGSGVEAFDEAPAAPPDKEILHLSGRILDNHKEPVDEAEIRVFINGQLQKVRKGAHGHQVLEYFKSESDGSYQVVIEVQKGLLPQAEIEIDIFKPSFKEVRVKIPQDHLAYNGQHYFAVKDVILERSLGPAFWISTVVFLLAYILISFELLHRTVAAMLGAAIMLVITYTVGVINPQYHIISYERAIAAIDMNVIFLLMGMMIIVGILKNTGVFQWCAYKSYQMARGNVFVLCLILTTFTAISSAFLDNVTTMLLLTPVTIEIALSLGLNPAVLLIPEILASNVGGTSTLIGDPPNIMIGSYTGLTFMDFVINLGPVVAISMIVLYGFFKVYYGREYKKATITDVEAHIAKLREEYRITDATLLTVGLIIMAVVIFFFITHGIWHMEVSVAALFGASLLFTYGIVTKRIKLLELVEKDIEWTTLLFFIFLFILVGAVEETGLLAIIADWVLKLSHGNLVAAICLILWVSAIMSAFVDNIPFTATMLPITAYLTRVIPGAENNVLWWALALGACFGGNGTMIGASANVVTLGIAESAGYPVKFFEYMKVGFVYMVISVAISNIWLLIFY